MRTSRLSAIAGMAVLTCGLAALGGGAASADEKKPAPAAAGEKAASAASEAEMAAWAAYGTPGPHHKVLDALIGTWDAKMVFWPSPGADPIVSAGTSEWTWVLGGRFVQQEFTGADASRAFTGKGFTGYNNASKRFESVWMDSEGTGMIRTTGAIDETGKVLTTTGEFADAMTGAMRPVKYVTRFVDANEVVFEMHQPGADGAFVKKFEVVYSKRS